MHLIKKKSRAALGSLKDEKLHETPKSIHGKQGTGHIFLSNLSIKWAH